MSKLPLDLSKFRKVKTDKNTTTFEHHEGHQITIAHNKLSSKLKDQLNSMPMAKPKVQKFKDGGDVKSGDDFEAAKQDLYSAGSALFGSDEENKKNYEDSVNSAPKTPEQGSVNPDYKNYGNQGPAKAPEPPQDTNAQALALSNAAAAQAQQPQASAPGLAQGTTAAADSAPPQQIQSQGMAINQGQPSADRVPAQVPAPPPPNTRDVLAYDDKQLSHELGTGQITPKTYHDLMGEKSTMGKIGSIFGLLLGGAGAGLTHSENPVTQMWDKTIQNDLNSQIKNADNKQSLYSLNLKGAMDKSNLAHMQLVDKQSVSDFTRMQMNRTMLHNLVSQVEQTDPNTPQGQKARQSLAMAGQYVDMQNSNLADGIAAKKAQMDYMSSNSGGGNDTAIRIKMTAPPGQQESLMKDLKTKRDMEASIDGIMKAFDYNAENNTLLGKLNPQNKERLEAAVDTKLMELARTAAGRFNMEEIPMTRKNFTSAIANKETVAFKRKEFEDSLRARAHFPSLELYGEKPHRTESISKAEAPQTATKNGIEYQKVPGGWMPVKK